MSRLHRPKAGFWIRLCVVLIIPVTRIAFRVNWRHLDRVPAPDRGGVIIAMNHTSVVDTLLMARFVWQSGRIPRFLIKSGVFRYPLIGRMMRGAKQIPVYRGTSDAADSLGDAVAALDRGEAVVIYPEGTITRDPDQWPMQGRTGIARLVLLRPATPVVPVGQWGAQHRRTRPLRERLGRRHTSLAVAGEPLDVSGFDGAQPSAEVLREITDLIMAAVRDLVADLRGENPPERFHVPARKYVDKQRGVA